MLRVSWRYIKVGLLIKCHIYIYIYAHITQLSLDETIRRRTRRVSYWGAKRPTSSGKRHWGEAINHRALFPFISQKKGSYIAVSGDIWLCVPSYLPVNIEKEIQVSRSIRVNWQWPKGKTTTIGYVADGQIMQNETIFFLLLLFLNGARFSIRPYWLRVIGLSAAGFDII